jgi:dipeptidyl aminopeptidase/acylaminoacyl peptidase
MFEYFPEYYPWTLSIAASIGMGGEISEIDDACRGLRGLPGKVSAAVATEAWFQGWAKLAQRLDQLSDQDRVRGYRISAGSKAFRAANYYLFAERNLPWSDPRRLLTYRKALVAFENGVKLRGDDAERVEVAYQGAHLAGWLHFPPGRGPFPCVLFYNGFDSIKEMHYLLYAAIAARRGLAVLFVDQEGTGEAIRLHKLPKRHDTEVSAKLFVDFLQSHRRIDPERIGIAGISAGGYCAPRAAAFEKRLKSVACLGGFFNLDSHRDMFLGRAPSGLAEGLSDLVDQLITVTGASSREEAVEIFSRRDLSQAIGELECPLLVLHGENDRQVPLWHAERTVAGAVRSPRAELKVFTLSEGAAEHCGIDIASMQGEFLFDWMAETLGAARNERATQRG